MKLTLVIALAMVAVAVVLRLPPDRLADLLHQAGTALSGAIAVLACAVLGLLLGMLLR